MSESHEGEHLFRSPRVRGVVVLSLLLLSVFLFAQSLVTFKEYRYVGSGVPASNVITVMGEAKVAARPDVATFSFTVREEAATPAEAQDRASQVVNPVVAFVGEQGVDEADVQTSNFQLSPKYERQCTGPRTGQTCTNELVGYTVSETVTIKVRQSEENPGAFVTDLGTLVAGLAERGVANVNGPNFEIDDETVYQAQAREEAIADAKQKAKELADDLDVVLVRIVNFNEFEQQPYFARSAVAMDMAQEEGLGGGIEAPSIPVGENEVLSQVMIAYEIR